MVAKRIQRRLAAILAVDVVGYRVTGTEVIDARHARLAPDDGRPVLSLVTCYPFDAIDPGGPLRYVVTAEGARDDNRWLLDKDGQGLANFSNLEN